MKPVLLALTALAILLAVVAPGFYSPGNLRELALNNVAALLAAVAVTLVILCGEIDISIGSQLAVCSVIVGELARAGVPAWVSGWRIPSIVATLATMAIFRDGLRWATGGAWVQDLPAGFQWFGLGQRAGPVAVFSLTAVIVAVLAWSLRHLTAGRALYATGSNSEAARLLGLRPQRLVFGAFTAAGALVGIAACLNAVRFVEVPANAGLGLEMKAIAAAVIGGAAITGGRGTVAGTVAGVALLGAIGTALTFLHVDASWEKAIQGAIILAAVAGPAVAPSFARSVRAAR
ncbi:MAG: ABC transporter permease [Acidobacteria bacterium]|nr:MAG: ABC transporter permease [Acidobacteriota bacterium]